MKTRVEIEACLEWLKDESRRPEITKNARHDLLEGVSWLEWVLDSREVEK